MTERPFAAIILAAGQGTRMRSAMPKVLHEIAGKPMLNHVADAVAPLQPARTVVVVGPGMENVAAAVPGADAAVQAERKGTAHAVLAARAALEGFSGDLVVLYGDGPLYRPATIRALRDSLDGGTQVGVLAFRTHEPHGYGRLVTSGNRLERIVEEKDATDDERAIDLCFSGLMALCGDHAWEILDAIGNDNAQGEFYLPDAVAVARARRLGCAVVECPEDEIHGVNSRAQLARVEAMMQMRLRDAAMDAGATLLDPASVYFSHDTKLGQDVIVEPNVFFGPGVTVGDGTIIKGFSHLEGTNVAANAQIGPFARLRPGAEIGEGARIGNYVEVKKARVEKGAKVNHLSYIGDARVGAGANIGAGTITCNYDGFDKHFTDIGAGAFIGSNSSLVAPVRIGDGAYTGSGGVITKDVSPDALAVERSAQKEVPGWAAKFRARKQAEKNKKAGE